MISVVVPVYKTEKYLPQCIESILAQSFEDFELLLVDDGSPDGSGAICDGYAARDGRIRVFHTENCGVSEARNTGIKESVGEYIAFCDSDDFAGRDWLRNLYEAAVKQNADICCSGTITEYVDRSVVFPGYEGCFTGSECIKALLCEKFSVNVWNKIFRRKLLSGVRFPAECHGEEIPFTAKLFLRAEKVVGIGCADYHYRQRKSSAANSYSMKVLVDYWNVHRERFDLVGGTDRLGEDPVVRDRLLMFCAGAASKAWRWARGTGEVDENSEFLDEVAAFVRENVPRSAAKGWPAHIRLTLPLIRLGGKPSLLLAYCANRTLRKFSGGGGMFD